MVLRYLFLILLMFSQNTLLFSQADETSKVEISPEFKGGVGDLYLFIKANIVYPKELKASELEGKVKLSFVIDINGKVSDIQIIDSIHPLFAKEAVRVIKKFNLPGNEWTPGMQAGKKVKVKYTLSIKFSPESSSLVPFVPTTKSKEIINIDKANSFYYLGTQKLELKDYSGAIVDYDSTLKYVPFYLDALYNRGVAKYNLKDPIGACIDWKKINSMGHPDADDFLLKFCK